MSHKILPGGGGGGGTYFVTDHAALDVHPEYYRIFRKRVKFGWRWTLRWRGEVIASKRTLREPKTRQLREFVGSYNRMAMPKVSFGSSQTQGGGGWGGSEGNFGGGWGYSGGIPQDPA